MARDVRRDVLTFSPDVTPAEIAKSLHISLGTIKRIISEVIEERGVKSRAAATLRAVCDGELSTDEIIWPLDDESS